MIKQYTFTTIAEHDAEYTDYRPNHIPAATCGYPYDLIYPTAYPTKTIVTVKCPKKNKQHKNHKNHKENGCSFMLVAKITIVILILLFLYNLIKVSRV